MSAADLWTATKAAFDAGTLTQLTNYRDRSAVAPDDTAGESAAQAVINLWPIHAQTEYDPDAPLHVEIGTQGVVAMLMRRGGGVSEVNVAAWDRVFGTDGMLARLRDTGPRARIEPKRGLPRTNRAGQRVLSWFDRKSLPRGVLPSDRTDGQG